MKSVMTASVLKNAGAECVSTLNRGVLTPSSHDMKTPGFYFVVSEATGLCHARFFCGRQRNGRGFFEVMKSINYGLTYCSRRLAVGGPYVVMFIAAENMKPLTTGYGKGQISMIFTKSHNDKFQNLSEINRMLNDNFRFILQKY